MIGETIVLTVLFYVYAQTVTSELEETVKQHGGSEKAAKAVKMGASIVLARLGGALTSGTTSSGDDRRA